MNCPTCNNLQLEVQAAARELHRAVNESYVAVAGVSAIAAGNRIQGAEFTLRIVTAMLEKHQAECGAHKAALVVH